MKKVTLLCLAEHREATLNELRDMGVLHLTPVQPPESADLQHTADELKRTLAVVTDLRAYSPETPPSSHSHADTIDSIVETVHETLARRKEVAERIEDLETERSDIAPLGQFDPAMIRDFAERGIVVRLYRRSDKKPVEPPEGVVEVPCGESGGPFFALAGIGEFQFDGKEQPLPSRAVGEIEELLKEARRELEPVDEELHRMASSYLSDIQGHAAALEARILYLEARAGMGDAGTLAYLRGFCPEDRVAALRDRAHTAGWGLVIEDPTGDEPVPTLVRYPGFVSMMKPVFKFLGIVPGYRETDISSAFLLFLSIFFAMIVGDAGYGLLFLILIPYFRARFPSADRKPFRLLTVFSVSAVAWGVLTGNYFGIDFALLPPPLRALRVDWLISQNNSMTLSLLLGAVHLTVAHAWRVIVIGLDARSLIQAGWIGIVWGVFALARMLLVGAPFPSWLPPVPILGFVAIVFGLIKTRQWLDMGFLMLDVVNCFGDLMSYLRLFALGIASVKVAEAFNGMAGNLGVWIAAMNGAGAWLVLTPPLAAIAMLFILTVGHGLNIVLCAMSVLVHGVRLNALEFSLHMGQEWSGFEYKPFSTAPEAA